MDTYTVDQIQLRRVESVWDLGVILDSKLTFIQHIDNMISSSNKMLGFFLRPAIFCGTGIQYFSSYRKEIYFDKNGTSKYVFYTGMSGPFKLSMTQLLSNILFCWIEAPPLRKLIIQASNNSQNMFFKLNIRRV